MSKADPIYDHWRQPPPGRIAFGVPGTGKTYSAPESTEKETADKEEEGHG